MRCWLKEVPTRGDNLLKLQANGYSFLIAGFFLFLVFLQPAFAVIPLETSPSWRSLESRAPAESYYSTGAVFGDIDGNGFLDLVISNGNDMLKAPNFVYFNYNGR